MLIRTFISLTCLLFFSYAPLYAQDNGDTVSGGQQEQLGQYLAGKTHKLRQYHKRVIRQQVRLLKQFRRREVQISKRLQQADSTLYRKYIQLSAYNADSLRHLLFDTAVFQPNLAKSLTDTLLRLQRFRETTGMPIAGKYLSGQYGSQLSALKNQLDRSRWLQQQLRQRALQLENIAGNSRMLKNVRLLKSRVALTEERIAYWKTLAQTPDEAETALWDALQSNRRFSAFMSGSGRGGSGLSNDLSASDLEAMGYQTRRSVEGMLQQQMGSELGNVQNMMGAQVKNFQEQLGKPLSGVKEQLEEGRRLFQSGKSGYNHLKQGLPKSQSHKSLRGVPFWHRWELSYQTQFVKPSATGGQPAMVDIGINAGFKKDKSLTLGIGIDGSLGLGSAWQHLRLSYEGLTVRVYANYMVLKGISLEGGYEKTLRPLNRSYVQLQEQYGNAGNLKTAMGLLQDAAYLGIMKAYRISKKLRGSFLIGYNFLNDKTRLSSPWMIRTGWGR